MSRPNWDMSRLIPFEKNFYREHPAVTNRSPVRSVELQIGI